MDTIRQPAAAGRFSAKHPDELATTVPALFDTAPADEPPARAALIVPDPDNGPRSPCR